MIDCHISTYIAFQLCPICVSYKSFFIARGTALRLPAMTDKQSFDITLYMYVYKYIYMLDIKRIIEEKLDLIVSIYNVTFVNNE